MSTLVYIGLLGVFAYHCTANGQNFRGSSLLVKMIQDVAGGLGYLLYLVTLVWCLWPFEWWHPIVTCIASIVVGGLSAILFQRSIIGMIVSPICVVVFAVLSIIGLI